MRVVVPFAAEAPKTRLADVFGPDERTAFAEAMLRDVLSVIEKTGHDPEVLATAPVSVSVPVTIDDRPLTPAINARIESGVPLAIVMADLPLVTPTIIERLLSESGDIVLAPGRAGGTNAIVVRDGSFRVDYHGTSYLDHLAKAREIDATVSVFDSHRLATDIDERADLVEILVHGDGHSKEWLLEAGFHLAVSEGRVGIERDD